MSLESKKTLWSTRGDAQGTADLEIEKSALFLGYMLSGSRVGAQLHGSSVQCFPTKMITHQNDRFSNNLVQFPHPLE